MARAPVVLNVYNMYWLNEYTSSIGLGVYHSGVEVYGKEYAFGGHPFEFTGIFDMEPKDIEELGEGFTFKETVVLGFTDFSEEDVKNLTEMLGKSFIGSSYHLVKKNCNHFSNEFSKLICGKGIPAWVNRLAALGTRFPLLAACIPKEWLTPDEAGGSLHYVDLTEWEEITYPDDKQCNNDQEDGQHEDDNTPLLTLTEMLALGDDTSNKQNVKHSHTTKNNFSESSSSSSINVGTSKINAGMDYNEYDNDDDRNEYRSLKNNVIPDG